MASISATKKNPDLLRPLDVARGVARLLRKQRVVREAFHTVMQLDDRAPLSIGSLLERNARRHPGQPAIKHLRGQVSYGELNQQANRIAHYLHGRGITKGDVVAVLVENRPEILAVVAGVCKLGAVAAMINTNQRHDVLLHSLNCCTPRAFVVGEELWAAFDDVRRRLHDASAVDCERPIYWVADGRVDAVPGVTIDFLTEVAKCSSDNPSTTRTVTLDDPCFYIFTSGTTGLPKAAILGHGRWVKGSVVMGRLCLEAQQDDTIYAPLPLYHNQALTVGWGAAMRAGASLAIRRKFSASAFWDDCRRMGATMIVYIGEIPRYLLNQPPSEGDRAHSVRKATGVGLRSDIWDDFKSRFGIDEVYEFYGASELNIAFINVMNLDRTAGFCTAPFAIVDFDVDAGEAMRNSSGHMTRVGRGGTGLMISRVTRKFRYEGYTDPEATERKLFRNVFKPGDVWVNSGDLVRDIGFRHIQFVDRVGDTFRWKSENVSTGEVEKAINTLPWVLESTVYGVEIPSTVGRAGMASVVLQPGAACDLDELYAHLSRCLPAYSVPVFVRITSTLEVTGTFKHRRVELRKEGYDGSDIADPIFVSLPGSRSYSPLTVEARAAVRRSEHRF